MTSSCAEPVGNYGGYPEEWREALAACLAPSISRLADSGSTLATWTNDPEKIRSTFARFALPDDASRFGGDRQASKQNYEDGMARSFSRFHDALRADGRLVIVFANKQPDAWETLVSALVRAGFVVDGSWPIRTERQTRQRSLSSAALSSSIWLVCKKRPATARPGWDGNELAEGGSEERATLESFQNHVRTRGRASALRQESLL